MARVHTEADIRAVCQHLIDTEGESALKRTAIQEGLRKRAVERGLEPTAADHRAVSDVIAKLKAELRTARESARTEVGAEDLPLPMGLESALQRHAREVEGFCRHALGEAARQSEVGTQARLRQVQSECGEQLAALRADLEIVQQDAATQAAQLDDAESALAAARASLASVTAALNERTVALESLDRATRNQLSAVQERLHEATAARIASDEHAHTSELAREKTGSDLAVALERIERLESELADRREAAKSDEAKVREAERTRDLAQGRLTAIEEDCAWLRLRLERVSGARQASAKGSGRTSPSAEKTKRAEGR
jgi:DNA repair exonuclease SbcCD ATPase subunit